MESEIDRNCSAEGMLMNHLESTLPEYRPGSRNEHRIIKTWKWVLPERFLPRPDNIEPRFYYCRREGSRELVPYIFEGETLFVCRSCGSVYEYIPPTPGRSDPLRCWRILYEQPYEYKYIKRPGEMDYDYIHCCEGITRHPIIDTHCKGDPAEAAELIVRHFSFMLSDDNSRGLFFVKSTKESTIQWDGSILNISYGKDTGSFANDYFCNYQEKNDTLSLDCSYFRDNCISGSFSVNQDDYEHSAERLQFRLTFLCDDSNELPGIIRRLGLPPDGKLPKEFGNGRTRLIDRRVTKDPLGLDGFFLYERWRRIKNYWTYPSEDWIWMDKEEDDDKD